MTSRSHPLVKSAGLICAGLAGRAALRRFRRADLRGQVVLITGGSRGLGLALAREFAGRGCRIAICGRDREKLERAREELAASGADVLAVACDVGDPEQIDAMVAEVTERMGPVDVLVANAGHMRVGPVDTTTEADFAAALDVMFWGVVRTVRAVLPSMRERRYGRIVAITSVGGKVSVPHLLPYSSAKFAAVGFASGLRAELAGTGVRVTTVAPGLIRTGSHVNVEFGGAVEREYVWFSLGASLPLIAMDAARAARQIADATARGDGEVILSIPAAVLARFHGLAPSLTADILGVVNRILPSAPSDGGGRARGHEIQAALDSGAHDRATTFGARAAARFNQTPPPHSAPSLTDISGETQ